jgi:hypothetical protein
MSPQTHQRAAGRLLLLLLLLLASGWHILLHLEHLLRLLLLRA